MSILNVEHLTHGFGDRAIFNDVSFRLLKGEHIGLVGANGEGKSTFMSIVTGKMMPDEGKVEWAKNVNVGYLDQHAVLEAGMTIQDALKSAFDPLLQKEERMNEICDMLGTADEKEMEILMEELGMIQDELTLHDFYTIDAKVEEVARALGLLDLGLDRDVTDLSGGQRTKVLLGKLLLEKPDILLLDEPTNYLDEEHIAWLKRYLLDYENAFILISHDIPFLNEVVNIIYHMENQELNRYVGDYDHFQEVYAVKKAQLEAAYRRQQQEINELKDFVARNKARVSTRNMAMSRQKKLDKMDLIELAAEKPKPEFNFRYGRTPGKMLFETKKLVIGYDEPLSKPLDFYMERGQKIALIGTNGIGKTTLLKSLLGLIPPLSGSCEQGENLQIGYFEQEVKGENPNSCIEEIWEEFPGFTQYEVRSALAKCGLTTKHIESKVRVLSGGEQAKVRLCKLINRDTNVLLLDEPTNHLDNKMSDWLENYLKSFRGVLLMVTHDRYFLDKVTNHIWEVEGGKVYYYDENYSGYLERKAEREERELASERKRQSILRSEVKWVMRGARARSTKQKARLERFEQLKAMDSPKTAKQVEMGSVGTRLGKKTIELYDISKAYGDKVLFKHFSYIFKRFERIGFVGHNGCGKSTLMKILADLEQADSGAIEWGETIKIGYFAQECEVMDERERVIDYIKDAAEYVRTSEGLVSASKMLERFLFSSDMQYTPIAKISGGERRRLYLLKVLMQSPNVLILDEPTNDLDIATLRVLEDFLDEFAGIVITVSHDRYFLDRTVDRIAAFENGNIVVYEGDYTEYQEKSGRIEADSIDSVDSGSGLHIKKSNEKKKEGREQWLASKNKEKKLKFSYKEQKEFETIDEDIEKLEEKIAELEEQISKCATDFIKLNELMQEKEKTEAELSDKMERWVYLNDLAEKIEAQKRENNNENI